MTSQRWKAQIAVTIVSGGKSSVLLTESVNTEGIFIRTDDPPPMNLLRLKFDLPPDNTPVALHGMALNATRSSSHGSAGVEISFFAMSSDASARWNNFVRYLRNVHPETSSRPVVLIRNTVTAIDRTAMVDDLKPEDVTPRGMFLHTRRQFDAGADVRIVLSSAFDPGAQVRVDGVIRRLVSGSRPGVGIEYRNMTARGWAELSAFLEVAAANGPVNADVRIVHTPRVPATMETLAGPGSSAIDDHPRLPREESWAPPPGWTVSLPPVV